MSAPFSYLIHGYPTSLQSCLRALEESAVYQEMPMPLQFVAELILDELASNTLKYGGRENPEVRLEIEYRNGSMRVEIIDNARPFDPWSQAPAVDDSEVKDIDDLEIGGRGIHMLLQATDTRHYERREGRNINIMTRSVQRAPQSAAA
ncbi:MAG: ATP-binding protein [Verrucomicrobiota bacterium]